MPENSGLSQWIAVEPEPLTELIVYGSVSCTRKVFITTLSTLLGCQPAENIVAGKG